jgi:hypothetical protein
MFTKNTVSKSMIDAVNQVLGEQPEVQQPVVSKNMLSEEKVVSEVSPPGWSGTTKAMKKHKNIDNPFALAWSMKNKGAKSHIKPEKKNEEVEHVEEGMVDALKKGVKAVGKALGGPDDEGHKKDLQRKMGIPQTGKPSMAKQNEESEHIDETFNDNMHPAGVALLKHIKPEHHNLYKPHLTSDVFTGSYKDRTDVLNAAKKAGHLKEEVEHIAEEMKTKTVHVPYVYTDRHGNGFGGYDVHYAKEHEAQAHVDRHGHVDLNGKKGWVEKHEIAKHPTHGGWVDANMLRRHGTASMHEETVEHIDEGDRLALSKKLTNGLYRIDKGLGKLAKKTGETGHAAGSKDTKSSVKKAVGKASDADVKSMLNKEEELKGNQKKIDKNHNGKIDAQDFKILRGQKKMKEDAEQIDEVLVGKMVKDTDGKMKMTQVHMSDDEFKKHKDAHDAARKKIITQRQSDRNARMEEEITTDTLVGSMKGGNSNSFKSFKSTLKGNLEKAPAAKTPESTAARKSVKAEEVQQEGWDDMVKDTKERMSSGPKPSGGSGVKKGSRYGGSKQKDEPEDTEKKTVKENKGPESDTVPFVTNDSAPISVARDTAQRAMKRIKTEMMGKIAN